MAGPAPPNGSLPVPVCNNLVNLLRPPDPLFLSQSLPTHPGVRPAPFSQVYLGNPQHSASQSLAPPPAYGSPAPQANSHWTNGNVLAPPAPRSGPTRNNYALFSLSELRERYDQLHRAWQAAVSQGASPLALQGHQEGCQVCWEALLKAEGRHVSPQFSSKDPPPLRSEDLQRLREDYERSVTAWRSAVDRCALSLIIDTLLEECQTRWKVLLRIEEHLAGT